MCTDESQYRDEWAGLTGRSPSEVYVPASIRDPESFRPECSVILPDGTASVLVRKAGKLYRLTLGNVSSPFPGRIDGYVRNMEEVPES